MKVKVKLLHPEAKIPTKAHSSDAGFDLYVASLEYDLCNVKQITYKFGIALQIPKGYMGLLFPRSSICKTCLTLNNSVGVIDSGYRGEITAVFDINTVKETRGKPFYYVGDRAAQLIIMPIPSVTLVESAKLSDSSRGDNGYGSSGNA